jgi:hypothetical protein
LLNFSNFSSVSTWMGYHANTVIFLFLCTRGPSLILNKGMAMARPNTIDTHLWKK